ncbi:unnamed protein product, partial [Larinioides sclopetarius]
MICLILSFVILTIIRIIVSAYEDCKQLEKKRCLSTSKGKVKNVAKFTEKEKKLQETSSHTDFIEN